MTSKPPSPQLKGKRFLGTSLPVPSTSRRRLVLPEMWSDGVTPLAPWASGAVTSLRVVSIPGLLRASSGRGSQGTGCAALSLGRTGSSPVGGRIHMNAVAAVLGNRFLQDPAVVAHDLFGVDSFGGAPESHPEAATVVTAPERQSSTMAEREKVPTSAHGAPSRTTSEWRNCVHQNRQLWRR